MVSTKILSFLNSCNMKTLVIFADNSVVLSHHFKIYSNSERLYSNSQIVTCNNISQY